MSLSQTHLLIDYGRRTYVFGLPWFTVTEDEIPKKSVAETVRRSQKSFDLNLIKGDEAPQYALAEKSSGIKPGAISAAAALSSNMGNDGWLYALEIEGHIWIGNGKDGYILPDGDLIFDNPEAAKEQFLRLEPNKWKSIHVPPSWKEPGAFPEERQKFFASDEVLVSDPSDIFAIHAKGWMRLKGMSPLQSVGKIGGAAAILAVLGYFGHGLIFPAAQAPTPIDQDEVRRMLAERARAEKQDQYREFDSQKPWTSIPDPTAYAKQCIQAMKQMPAAGAGYVTQLVTCDGTIVQAELQKTDGTYALWLHEWAKGQTGFDIDIAQGGDIAYAVKDISALPARGAQDIKNYSFASNALNEASAISESDLTVSDPVVYRYEEYPDYIPIYGTSEIDITTDNPDAWLNTFEKVGGVEIRSIILDPNTMTYNFKGKIYVSNR